MHGHNPDILTCLANLSADEVFTPPKLAVAMLDGLPQELFSDPTTTFLDPFTKSGVFLREIASRLNDGLRDQMPDDQARIDHILTKQVFGMATGELTWLLARRTVYCSKKADGRYSISTRFDREWGNILYRRMRHRWDKKGKCQDCGANRGEYDRDETQEAYAYPFIHGVNPEKEFDVKFDVIVGNPPYQLSDGGHGRSAAPVYDQFVEQAKKLEPRFLSMVIPARWFSGGKGLDEFRSSMLGDDRLRVIEDYLTASDVFPGVGLKGGVCYFLWNRDDRGLCRVATHFQGWPDSVAVRPLLEEGVDTFIRFNEGVSILKKVVAHESGEQGSLSLPESRQFCRLVSSRKPFGLDTTFKGDAIQGSRDLVVYQNGGMGYTTRDAVKSGHELVDAWKLFIGYAAPGTGNKDTYPHRIISTPFVGEPQSISSETYLCIGPFNSRSEVENAKSYLSCRLPRFLVLMNKPSQHVTRKVYRFVPAQDWSRPWSDDELYEKYDLSLSEIDFIEKIVRPMEGSE